MGQGIVCVGIGQHHLFLPPPRLKGLRHLILLRHCVRKSPKRCTAGLYPGDLEHQWSMQLRGFAKSVHRSRHLHNMSYFNVLVDSNTD